VWTPVASINIVSIPWQQPKLSNRFEFSAGITPKLDRALPVLETKYECFYMLWNDSYQIVLLIHQRWDILSDNKAGKSAYHTL
jgi:hypothetical protein